MVTGNHKIILLEQVSRYSQMEDERIIFGPMIIILI